MLTDWLPASNERGRSDDVGHQDLSTNFCLFFFWNVSIRWLSLAPGTVIVLTLPWLSWKCAFNRGRVTDWTVSEDAGRFVAWKTSDEVQAFPLVAADSQIHRERWERNKCQQTLRMCWQRLRKIGPRCHNIWAQGPFGPPCSDDSAHVKVVLSNRSRVESYWNWTTEKLRVWTPSEMTVVEKPTSV